jgi:shikimate kinase
MTGASQAESEARSAGALRERLGVRSIVLIGMPGSGKSSVGRRLAARLGLDFIDSDAEIEAAAGGMSIADIFAKHGEGEFRSLEARVIARLLDRGPIVLATGGGAFMNPATRADIGDSGISVWLKADFSVLLKRIRRKNDRPLFRNGDQEGTLKRLLAEREPVFANADIAILSDESPHETTVDLIIEAVGQKLADASTGGAPTGMLRP